MDTLVDNSSSRSGRVLVVEDDAVQGDLLATALKRQGFEVTVVRSAESGLRAVAEEQFEAVLTDINLPGMSGLQFCARLVASRPDLAVIIMTAFAGMRSAIEAIRAGAYDYVEKPLDFEGVGLRLTRIVRECRIRQEAKRLRALVTPTDGFGELVGTSGEMQKVYGVLARAAETDATVLIAGESGTGKELAARALHTQGVRKDGPMVVVDCSALSERALESELFGHVRGAFADALTDQRGAFLQAQGGTLLLDEISEIPLALQTKLVRTLEERRVRPLGSNEAVDFDVRLVVASNRDLETAVEEQRFREELLSRIDVVRVAMPPLRARSTDVLLLAQRFIARFAAASGKDVQGMSPGAAQRLCDYDWPGNVRELRNSVERAVVLTGSRDIEVEDLPERIRDHKKSDVVISAEPDALVSLEDVERRYITRVVETVGGNKTLAAKILGLDRKTLYRKLERYRSASR